MGTLYIKVCRCPAVLCASVCVCVCVCCVCVCAFMCEYIPQLLWHLILVLPIGIVLKWVAEIICQVPLGLVLLIEEGCFQVRFHGWMEVRKNESNAPVMCLLIINQSAAAAAATAAAVAACVSEIGSWPWNSFTCCCMLDLSPKNSNVYQEMHQWRFFGLTHPRKLLLREKCRNRTCCNSRMKLDAEQVRKLIRKDCLMSEI